MGKQKQQLSVSFGACCKHFHWCYDGISFCLVYGELQGYAFVTMVMCYFCTSCILMSCMAVLALLDMVKWWNLKKTKKKQTCKRVSSSHRIRVSRQCRSAIIHHWKEHKLAHNYESCECHHAGQWVTRMRSDDAEPWLFDVWREWKKTDQTTEECASAWTYKSYYLRSTLNKSKFSIQNSFAYWNVLCSKSSYTGWSPSYDTYYNLPEQSLQYLWPAWHSINCIKDGSAYLSSQCCWKHPHCERGGNGSPVCAPPPIPQPPPLVLPVLWVLCVLSSMWCYAHSTFN